MAYSPSNTLNKDSDGISETMRRRNFLLLGGTALLAGCGGPTGSLTSVAKNEIDRRLSPQSLLSPTSMSCGSRWFSTVTVNSDRSISIAPQGNTVIPSGKIALNGSNLLITVNGSTNSFTLPADPNTIGDAFQTSTSDGTLTKFNGAAASATAFDADGISASLAYLNDGTLGLGITSNGSTLQNGTWETALSTSTITSILQQASQIQSNLSAATPSPGSTNLVNNNNIIQQKLQSLSNGGDPTPKPCIGKCPPPQLAKPRRIHTQGTMTCYDLIKTTIDNQTGAVLAQVDLGTIFCALDNFPSYNMAGKTNAWGGGGGIVHPTPTPSAYDKFRCIASAILASAGVTAIKGWTKVVLNFAKGNPQFWSLDLEGGAAVVAFIADLLWPLFAAILIGLTIWAIYDAIQTCRQAGVI